MEIKIFDVEHGFCAYIVADSKNVALIDVGHNATTGFRPSTYLSTGTCTGIEKLIISNYDEDHFSDLPALRQKGNLPILVLTRNQSITADQLEALKKQGGPLGPGMQALLAMIRTYTATLTAPIDWGGAEFAFFSNPYPTFTDTNSLSLVTFLHYRDIHIVFPGDLTVPGWRELLTSTAFCDHLRRVKLFVASHHGRQDGYCPEVFDLCKPWFVLISDEAKLYDTQDVNYAQHASGIQFGSQTRYVLTTRNDGRIRFSQSLGQQVKISIGG